MDEMKSISSESEYSEEELDGSNNERKRMLSKKGGGVRAKAKAHWRSKCIGEVSDLS